MFIPRQLLAANYKYSTDIGSAVISDDDKYRYVLTRYTENWMPASAESGTPIETENPDIPFVMLNPSTADAFNDDATIRRCLDFANRFKMRNLIVVNLFAFRATKPADMKKAKDPIGAINDDILDLVLHQYPKVICAWGSGADKERVFRFKVMAGLHDCELLCLAKTAKGDPRHPVRLPKDSNLMPLEGDE